MDVRTIKTPNPLFRLFFKIDLLTDIAALNLTDFIDWRYIHSLVGFRPSLWTVAPMDKGTILVYCAPLSSLWPPHPSPLPKLNVHCTLYIVQHMHIQTVCVWGGGMNCAVDHILQEFFTLFLTRFRTYQIASPPQTKWPVKTTLRVLCL
jgi:hypothetical protein